MNKADWKSFCELMNAAAEEIGAKPKSAGGLSMTFKLLHDYSLGTVQKAVYQFLLSSEAKYGRVPNASQLREIINGDPEERGHYAWRLFLTAMDRRGYYDSVRFPEPAYHYAIQLLGGWELICEEYSHLTDKELDFRRGSFSALFAKGERESSFDPIPGKVQVRPYLPGYFETNNLANGYTQHLPPVYDIESGQKISRDQFKLTGGRGPDTQISMLMDGIYTLAKEEVNNGTGI